MNKESILNVIKGMAVITIVPLLLTLATGFLVPLCSPILFLVCFFLVFSKYAPEQKILPISIYFILLHYLIYSFYPGDLSALLQNNSYWLALAKYYASFSTLSLIFSYLGLLAGSLYISEKSRLSKITNILILLVLLNIPLLVTISTDNTKLSNSFEIVEQTPTVTDDWEEISVVRSEMNLLVRYPMYLMTAYSQEEYDKDKETERRIEANGGIVRSSSDPLIWYPINVQTGESDYDKKVQLNLESPALQFQQFESLDKALSQIRLSVLTLSSPFSSRNEIPGVVSSTTAQGYSVHFIQFRDSESDIRPKGWEMMHHTYSILEVPERGYLVWNWFTNYSEGRELIIDMMSAVEIELLE